MQLSPSTGHLFFHSEAFAASGLDTGNIAIILSLLIIVVTFSAHILFKWLRARKHGTTLKRVLKERIDQSVVSAMYKERRQSLERIHDSRQESEKYKTEVEREGIEE
jgi:uncharacterized membrane protein YhiD involved in acid resistance